MNFQPLLRDLHKVYTLQQIADMCGFASRGHVHDVMRGNQIGVKYEIGAKVINAHSTLKNERKRGKK